MTLQSLQSMLQLYPSERWQNIQTLEEYGIGKSEEELDKESFREGERMVDLRYELSPLAQEFYDFCRDNNLKWKFYESMLDGERKEDKTLFVGGMDDDNLPF